MVNKNNFFTVGVVIIVSGALVVGLATWLGPKPSSEALLTNDADEVSTPEALEAPLNADQLDAYQVDVINQNNPVATFVTNLGTFELELFADSMPITAGNFIKLAKEGYYDGVKFHRVIENFMIQSGDPLSKTDEVMRYGTGGPGYTIPDEFVAGELLTNVRGTIAMANSGPESGGSQFFINVVNNQNLDFDKPPMTSRHPVFGRVISGMDVVDQISTVETGANNIPVEPVVVESVSISQP